MKTYYLPLNEEMNNVSKATIYVKDGKFIVNNGVYESNNWLQAVHYAYSIAKVVIFK